MVRCFCAAMNAHAFNESATVGSKSISSVKRFVIVQGQNVFVVQLDFDKAFRDRFIQLAKGCQLSSVQLITTDPAGFVQCLVVVLDIPSM